VVAQFPPPYWSVYDRVQQDVQRTNNHVEGWHNGMQPKLAKAHPSIYKFVDVLKIEVASQNRKITRYLAGDDAPKPKKEYRILNNRINNLVRRFDNRPRYEYLESFALAVQL
jgi:hypothetical protein